MGFNAARLEWNVAGLKAPPKSVTTDDCDIATAADIESSMLPPSSVGTPKPSGNPILPQDPPAITDGVCNSDLPTTSTTDRFVYMANYLCSQVCSRLESSRLRVCITWHARCHLHNTFAIGYEHSLLAEVSVHESQCA